MNFMQVEDYFEKKEFSELISACKEDFAHINEISSRLKSGIIDNPQEARNTLGVLCGCFGFLNTVYKIAKFYEEDIETKKFNEIRIAYEKNPVVDEKGKVKSFVQGTADKEAKEYVSDYCRIRSIVQGYVEVCTTDIGAIQSILKSFGMERTFNEAS